MISPPEAVVGQSIRKWAFQLAAWLRSERIIAGQGVLIKQTAGGRTLSASGNEFRFYFVNKYYSSMAALEAEIGARPAGTQSLAVNLISNALSWSASLPPDAPALQDPTNYLIAVADLRGTIVLARAG